MTKMADPTMYSVRVQQIEIEGSTLFEGTVDEVPGIATYAEAPGQAYNEVLEAIAALQAAAVEDGREFPAPRRPDQEFSGRVTLRLPASVHRQASRLAEVEGVSLNTCIVSVLSAHTAIAETAQRAADSVADRVEQQLGKWQAQLGSSSAVEPMRFAAAAALLKSDITVLGSSPATLAQNLVMQYAW